MIFTLIENISYVTHVPKFVEIQNNDHHSIQNFVHDLEELTIYCCTIDACFDMCEKRIYYYYEKRHTSEENYGILLKLL